MFTLTKETNIINAADIKIGCAFQHEGEICIRIKAPKTGLTVDANKVIAVSLETWELRGLDSNVPVEMVAVSATSRPMGHAD